jgi:GMP synthase-like glutamine amidotransferase
MSGNKVLAIQNSGIETLGNLEKLFESDGYVIESMEAGTLVPDDPTNYSAIIILGGYMSVYENLPYLIKEQELIKKANACKVPVLGICLGSQLIAQALGGRVYRGKKKEIGWFDIALTDEGRRDIFRGIMSKKLKVFQWHGDTFDLPKTATLLATSEHYPQAFRIGTSVGILFHLEIQAKMAEKWVKEYDLELEQEGINKDQILKNRDYEFNNLVDRCKVVYSNFSKMIGFV